MFPHCASCFQPVRRLFLTTTTYREIIEMPERVDREEEGIDTEIILSEAPADDRNRDTRESEDVDHEPADELPLSMQEEDDNLYKRG